VRIGDFHVARVRALWLDAAHKRPRQSRETTREPLPVLGNCLFRDTAFTIDFRARNIVFHRTGFGLERRSARHDDYLLDLKWAMRAGDELGKPAIEGTLSRHHALIMLDTGCSGGAISEALRRRIGSTRVSTRTAETAAGRWPVRMVSGLHGTVAGCDLRGDFAVSASGFGADAALGYDFMHNFRVTFDYPHGKVLLEPYPDFLATKHTHRMR